ncbi:MAG: DMT family transporter [Clostridia bacterium]|nr:DMT family transporter [Clostridia bacterium]
MEKQKKRISSAPLCLISAVIWGISFPIQDMASLHSEALDAFSFTGLRFLLGALALLPIALLTKGRQKVFKPRLKSTILSGSLAGVILFAASVFQQIGIQMTNESGKAGFITSLYLIFVPIVCFLVFRQKCSKFVIIAIPVAVLGLYFLSFTKGSFHFAPGDALVLVGSFLFTGHIIALDRSAPSVTPLLFSCVQFATSGILGVIFGSAFGVITAEGVVACLLPILFCGLFSTGIAYTLQLLGQKNGNPTVCALFCSTESLFAIVAECIIERAFPTTEVIIGCVLMLGAVLLSQIPPKQELINK